MFSIKTYVIFFTYFIGSFLFKETHPFSRFPMYNQFPNWSYVFYLSDEDKNLIPSMIHFNISGGWIGHTFYSICNSEGIKYGDDIESIEDLSFIGKKMFEQITKKNPVFLAEHDTIYLNKISFSIQDGAIVKKDEIIYAHYH